MNRETASVRICRPICKKVRIEISAADAAPQIVIAGPPGSGKSSAFPVSGFGVDYFNADDRAAELNGGSYLSISQEIRRVVNNEYQQFVLNHIRNRGSFAIETTLRTQVTFEQAGLARAEGFYIEMRYLALDSFASHMNRVRARAFAGGHSASETTLRRIYSASLANLKEAVAYVDELWVYDNSAAGREPELVMEARAGRSLFVTDSVPAWLRDALR